MECIKCKKEIPDGSAFCNHCGKRQTPEPRKHKKRANGTGEIFKLSGSRAKPWAARKAGEFIGTYATRTEAQKALDRLTDVEITAMETTASPESEATGYGVALDAASIRDMEIEWAAGSIRILPKDITEIRITEEGVNQSEKPMVWKVRDGKLAIQYAENKKISLGIGTPSAWV